MRRGRAPLQHARAGQKQRPRTNRQQGPPAAILLPGQRAESAHQRDGLPVDGQDRRSGAAGDDQDVEGGEGGVGFFDGDVPAERCALVAGGEGLGGG